MNIFGVYRVRNAILIALGMLAAPAYSGNLDSAWGALNLTTFNELVAKVHRDSVAGLSLGNVAQLLASGAEVDESRANEVLGYQMMLKVSAAKNTASLMFYMPDAGYEKLGTNYGQAYGLLEARAMQLGLSKAVSNNDLINGDDVQEAATGRSVWRWQSNGFSCRLLIDDAAYFGGDILYECNM